jgi:uncharacterized protein (DUF2252 family)
MKKKLTFHLSMPEARQEALVRLRGRKMARGPHAYVRGNTERFYDWLDGSGKAAVPAGPPVWICGDCHLGNLGPVAGATGDVDIQIRDLDQTVIGNPAYDLIRLGLSLASAARGSNLSGRTTSTMLEQLIIGYGSAFSSGDEPPLRIPKPDPVRIVLKSAVGRTFQHLRRERFEGKREHFPLGRRFWPLRPEERDAVRAICGQPETLELVTSLKCRSRDATVRFLDAAYWVKGCSSLGKVRYAALLEVADESSSDRDFCLIDIKEAVRAVAPRDPDAAMPRDNAERVVTGARKLSPFLGERMLPVRIDGHAAFVRELLPQDLKIDIEALDEAQAGAVALYLAAVVGRAHARQMDVATQRQWFAELKRNHTKGLEAPSWLWRSVVDLLGNHEVGYLEHCRRQAALDAAFAERQER